MKSALTYVGCLLIAFSIYSQKTPEIKIIQFEGQSWNNIPILYFTNALLKFDSLEESQQEIKVLKEKVEVRDGYIEQQEVIIFDLQSVAIIDEHRITNYEGILTQDSLTIQKQKKQIRQTKVGAVVVVIIAFLL